jgi:hypothetical protein
MFKWPPAPIAPVHQVECPACKRTREKVPGGYLRLEGSFLMVHQKEISHLITNVAHAEMGQHPLQRIIEVLPLENGIEITTTYEHIARRIADAVHRSYNGDLTIKYSDEEKRVRIHWVRDL